MSDYNVNMKKFNGTDYDNILPMSYLAKTAEKLGGGATSDIITQARNGLSQIATGSYVGNGQISQNISVSITMPFAPKLLLIFPWSNIEYTGDASYTLPAFLTYFLNLKGDTWNLNFLYGIWYDGLTRTPLNSVYYNGDKRGGAEIIYSLSGTTLTWKVVKPDKANSFQLYTFSAEMIYNGAKTYHWLAIG